MRKRYLFYLLFTACLYEPVRAQSGSTRLVSLRSVIVTVESQTDYRFLYRDALVSDVAIPSESNTRSYIPKLDSLLHNHQIGVKVDHDRKQIFLYQESNETKVTESTLSGHVVDAQSGSRLPFATISWEENGKITGTSTDQNGSFIIRGSDNQDDSDRTLTISYIGYQKQVIGWSPTMTPNTDLTVRLEPDAYTGNEVVITGNHFYQSYPGEFSKFLRLGTFSPVGETSTIRALQEFPAVSLNAGLTNGLHVRGSSSDGLRVTLDGATVYDQSHLFGLLDIFNSDVMQTVGFHYDITPAEYEGALGGTLQLLTRT
ncbi:MAG TPA: carboxypeptidase-like regulatory domain-containing protein, partial [Balneolales bacterium]|nr:carboxypeptidase-like regulatory domain-containing protein [Balneolales bacterium]